MKISLNYLINESDEQKIKMIDDIKDRYRFRMIEDEGNDPVQWKMKNQMISKNL